MKELVKREAPWPVSMGRLHEEMDRLFGKFFGELSPMEVFGSCVVDIREDDRNVYVDAELPGMKKDEIDVSIENGLLTISGEKKIEPETRGQEDLKERYYGRMYRCLTLPSAVNEDKVKATMQDGVLRIVLEKNEEAKPRRIPIE